MGPCKRKKEGIFILLIFLEVIFFNIFVLSRCIVYWIHFQNKHVFYISENITSFTILLVSKIVESLWCLFKVSAFATASQFCEWAQGEIDEYISHCKYMVKLHSSPWFSAACAAALFHWIHFFCLHQQNKSSEPRAKFK